MAAIAWPARPETPEEVLIRKGIRIKAPTVDTTGMTPARAKYVEACVRQGIPVVEISDKVRRRLKKWENMFPNIRGAAR